MLIVLEGLDGAGKSTQVKMFREYLERELGEIVYIHFPRYESAVYGELIGKFLRGDFGAIDQVHPQLVALLFAEDRHNAVPIINEALAEGKTVLLDRYVYSNIAYQCAKLEDENEAKYLRDWIFDTEYNKFQLPKPDLNLFLDVPILFVEQNLESNRNSDADRSYLHGAQDIHEADIQFQKRVRQIYLQETKLDPKFLAIECGNKEGAILPKNEIFNKVIAEYESYKKN